MSKKDSKKKQPQDVNYFTSDNREFVKMANLMLVELVAKYNQYLNVLDVEDVIKKLPDAESITAFEEIFKFCQSIKNLMTGFNFAESDKDTLVSKLKKNSMFFFRHLFILFR